MDISATTSSVPVSGHKFLKQQLEGIVKTIPGSIYCKDLLGRYTLVNRRALEAANLSSEQDIIGKTDFDVFSPEKAAAYQRTDMQVVREKRQIVAEELSTDPGGRELIQLSTKSPLYDEAGNVVGVVCNTVDISELKKTQAELELTKQNLENANQSLLSFLSFLDYHTRTHLSDVLSGLDVFETKVPDDLALLEKLRESSLQMLPLLENINYYAKLKLGKIDDYRDEIYVQGMLESLVRKASTPDVPIQFSMDGELPEEVVSNYLFLKNVINIFLENAVSHATDGLVQLSAKVVNRKDNTVRLRFSVENHGKPISENTKKNLQRFFVGEGGYDATQHPFDLGLKLSIVSLIAQLLDGEIGFECDDLSTVSFWFEAEFKLPEAETSGRKIVKRMAQFSFSSSDEVIASNEIKPKAQRLLLVGETPTSQLVFRSLLESSEHELVVCDSFVGAIQEIRTRLCDAIFVNVNLSNATGLQFIEALRSAPSLNQQVPCVAMTAHAAEEDIERIQAYPIDEILLKPLAREELDEVITSLFPD
ncbi:MAG: hypothetical protein DHS20C10_13700 [marine bacterium B5-7]|nr:MAG: hypothetical protein DHS20C10_13700 [marine bacterium B5-7]